MIIVKYDKHFFISFRALAQEDQMTHEKENEARQFSIAGVIVGVIVIIVGIANLFVGAPILTGAFPSLLPGSLY